MRLVMICMVLSLAVCWTSTVIGQSQPDAGDQAKGEDAIPFEVFAGFKRIEKGNPIIALEPPLWAAATHAIVVDETVHYIWCKRDRGRRWLMMHATAPVDNLTDIKQDARNPIVVPSEKGFDDEAVEYPFPFLNPADGKFYMYYRGKGKATPEQTGLLVSDGDMGKWTRVRRCGGRGDSYRLYGQGDAVVSGWTDHVSCNRADGRPGIGHKGSGQSGLQRQRAGMGQPGRS